MHEDISLTKKRGNNEHPEHILGLLTKKGKKFVKCEERSVC